LIENVYLVNLSEAPYLNGLPTGKSATAKWGIN